MLQFERWQIYLVTLKKKKTPSLTAKKVPSLFQPETAPEGLSLEDIGNDTIRVRARSFMEAITCAEDANKQHYVVAVQLQEAASGLRDVL